MEAPTIDYNLYAKLNEFRIRLSRGEVGDELKKSAITTIMDYQAHFEKCPEKAESSLLLALCEINQLIQYHNGPDSEILKQIKTIAANVLAKVAPTIMERFGINLKIINNLLREDPEQDILPFCPEEFYSDFHWKSAMKASKFLPWKEVDWYHFYGIYMANHTYVDIMSHINEDYWNLIGDYKAGKLFLGALPVSKKLSGRDDSLTLIEKEQIQAVLSVVDVFENRTKGWVSSPITPEKWQSKGIKHLQIPTTDFETIEFHKINRAVEFIHWNLRNRRNIYVHCKAGRGRSSLIVMCYLVKHENMTAEDAYFTVKKERPQAAFSLEDPKYDTLQQFEAFCKG